MRTFVQCLSAGCLLAFAGLVSADSIDINSADAGTLAEALEGVGETRAGAIVSHREENGPFADVDALLDVSGIGPATLESNRERLIAEDD